MEINDGDVKARAYGVQGRRTDLTVLHGSLNTKIESVRVVGRTEPALTERARDEFLLRVLQGATPVDLSPFVRKIFLVQGKQKGPSRNAKMKALKKVEDEPAFSRLNASQRQVASAMVGDVESLVVAQGMRC